ncbi:MAG: hypothetical protein JKX76_02630 [Colwellia sp.]|nr:hypothetical protein [Colwellia sp.]
MSKNVRIMANKKIRQKFFKKYIKASKRNYKLSGDKINHNIFLLNHDDIKNFLEFYQPYSQQLQPLVTVILRKFKDIEYINFYKNCVYLLISVVVDFVVDIKTPSFTSSKGTHMTGVENVITGHPSWIKTTRFGLPPGLNIRPIRPQSEKGYYKSQTVYTGSLTIVSRQINFETKLVVSPYPLGPGTSYMQSALDILYTLNPDNYTLFVGYSTEGISSDFHIGVSGKANKKEKLVTASLRETNEETGIIINSTQIRKNKPQKLLSKDGKKEEVLISHVTITQNTKFGKVNFPRGKDAKPRVIVILSGTKDDMINALEHTRPFLEGENISEYAAVKISDAILILDGIIEYNKQIISMELARQAIVTQGSTDQISDQQDKSRIPKWKPSIFDFTTGVLNTNI